MLGRTTCHIVGPEGTIGQEEPGTENPLGFALWRRPRQSILKPDGSVSSSMQELLPCPKTATPNRASTAGTCSRGVFNAATIWWADGLSAPPGYLHPSAYGAKPKGPDRRVQRITANLLDRFKGKGN